MELEVGMYIRSKINGTIGKITDIEDIEVSNGNITIKNGKRYILDNNYNRGFCETEQDSVIASYNIIDLIEVGDYVNGERVVETDIKGKLRYLDKNRNLSYVEDLDIKTIVTKEQFESMSYKVDDAK